MNQNLWAPEVSTAKPKQWMTIPGAAQCSHGSAWSCKNHRVFSASSSRSPSNASKKIPRIIMHFEYVYISVVCVVYVTSWWKLPGQDNADWSLQCISVLRCPQLDEKHMALGALVPPRRQWIREHLLHGVTQSLWPHYGHSRKGAGTEGLLATHLRFSD